MRSCGSWWVAAAVQLPRLSRHALFAVGLFSGSGACGAADASADYVAPGRGMLSRAGQPRLHAGTGGLPAHADWR